MKIYETTFTEPMHHHKINITYLFPWSKALLHWFCGISSHLQWQRTIWSVFDYNRCVEADRHLDMKWEVYILLIPIEIWRHSQESCVSLYENQVALIHLGESCVPLHDNRVALVHGIFLICKATWICNSELFNFKMQYRATYCINYSSYG